MKKLSIVRMVMWVFLGIGLIFFLTSCAGMAPVGAALGTIPGAVGGAIIGNQSGNPIQGAIIGGAAGAAAGYAIGNEQDKLKTQRQLQQIRRDMNTTIVNVHNSNGSTTPVPIKRVGSHYVGPRGEEYDRVPSERQLKRIYGF